MQVLLGPWLLLGVCSLSVLLCMAVSEIWKEKSKSMAEQMNSFSDLFGIKRMYKILSKGPVKTEK